MTRIHTAITEPDRTDRQVSMVLLFVLFVSLTLWSAYIETDGKYVLYTLPVTVFLSHLLFKGPHLVLESRGIAMMFLYAMAATAALALGGSSNAFTSRDLLIILGYLSFFCFQHRSPPIVPAASLLILAAAMAIDVADRPIAISFDLLTSQGLAESSLAFPIGLLVIYFFYERRWLMLFLSSLLFFAAFKRIAILGVAVVIALHVTMRVFGWRSIPRTLAIALVLGCSVFSLFSLQIFEYAANLIADPNVSQNSL